MHCREFRDKHVAFVDDLLPAMDMEAMGRHLSVCPGCARQDVRVRRSLLLVRNLPPIEASPEFMGRLNARLAELEPVDRVGRVGVRAPLASVASFTALAAGIAAVAYLAIETNNYFVQGDDLRLGAASSVAVSAPAAPLASSSFPISNAALVAAVPTGIPVWPAVLMVGQSPMLFADMDFRDGEQGR